MFDEEYLRLFEVELSQIVDGVLALLLAKKLIRECFEDAEATDDLERIEYIIKYCDQNIDLLYSFKEAKLDEFMSKKWNVLVLESYL